MMHEAGLIRKSALPISAGLLADVKSYFRALEAYRDGDLSLITEQICKAAIEAVDVGRKTVGWIEALRTVWAEKIHARKGAAAWRLADVLLIQPVVDAKFAVSALGITDPAARNAIDTLVDAGILTKIDNRMRDVLYEASDVTKMMDAFAQGLARRR
jgi:Fic family protein